jgi:hypothetical protein
LVEGDDFPDRINRIYRKTNNTNVGQIIASIGNAFFL